MLLIKTEKYPRKQISKQCRAKIKQALSKLTSFYTKDRLPQINDIINYEDVYSAQWNSDFDIDLKRRKEAELLVKSDLPIHFIRGYVVYNEKAKLALTKLGIDGNMIKVSPSYYF